MHLSFSRDTRWHPKIQFTETDSTFFLVRILQRLWSERPQPRASLIQIGVTLSKLIQHSNHTPDLFQGVFAQAMMAAHEKLERLDAAIRSAAGCYGRQIVYLGSVQNSRDAAPMRISFNHIPELDLERD
jgi:DNA polymerase-4